MKTKIGMWVVALMSISSVNCKKKPAPMTIEQFCTALNQKDQQACGYRQRCCSSADQSTLHMDLTRSCSPERLTERSNGCARQLHAMVDSHKVNFNGAKAAECVAVLTSRLPAVPTTCSGPNPWASATLPRVNEVAECQQVFTGTVAVGGECREDEECVSGSSCVREGEIGSPNRRRTCRPRLAAGAACGTSVQGECPQGQHCIDGHCGARRAQGQPCRSSIDCDRNLNCARPEGAEAGVCQPLAAVGQPCRRDYDCVSESCQNNVCAAVCTGANR